MSAPSDSDVRVERLRFSRGGRTVVAIDDLDFPAGSTTAVLGANGAGKTTLLRIISGLERPDKGRVLIGSSAVSAPSRAVSFAFQSPVFLRGTSRENIAIALELRGVPARERPARIEEAARKLDITTLLAREAQQLSRGEAQRLSLARALSLRSPITLLDEPLAALDANVRSRLLDELPRIFGEARSTVILVTHDRDEALRTAERLVILDEGRVRAAGTAKDVFKSPPDPTSARLLGYCLVPTPNGDGVLAAPPGALEVGEGDPPLSMITSRTLETAQGTEVIGVINGFTVRASLPKAARPPAPGEPAPLRADAWVRFTGASLK